MEERKYQCRVPVLAWILPNGEILPKVIRWYDGKKFNIVRSSKPVPRASFKAGGSGLRFMIEVEGATEEKPLYLEEDENSMFGVFFVESKQPPPEDD